MRRTVTTVLAGLLGLLALGVAPALGDAPQFHSVSSSVNSSGALVVSFDERGLGNGDINYLLQADAKATWACVNGGGKNPSAANKRTASSPVSKGGTFQSRNGRVQATLTAGPPPVPSDFKCPSGQKLVLASVSYTDGTLTDTTNGVSTPVPDASRTFYDV